MIKKRTLEMLKTVQLKPNNKLIIIIPKILFIDNPKPIDPPINPDIIYTAPI